MKEVEMSAQSRANKAMRRAEEQNFNQKAHAKAVKEGYPTSTGKGFAELFRLILDPSSTPARR